VESEARVRRVARMRPAAQVVHTGRNKVLCAYINVCVCVSGNGDPADRVVPRISVIFLRRTQHAARRWPINTAGATARFGFHYQPRRYSCPAFLARKASRVVLASRGSVCIIEYHAERNRVILRHLTTRQQIRGRGGRRNNQPPHPQDVLTELKQNW